MPFPYQFSRFLGYDLSSFTSHDADRGIARKLLYISDDYNSTEEEEEEEEKNCTSPGENTLTKEERVAQYIMGTIKKVLSRTLVELLGLLAPLQLCLLWESFFLLFIHFFYLMCSKRKRCDEEPIYSIPLIN